MPTVFTAKGLRFFFYSNDHEPIHIHVEGNDGSARIEVCPNIRVLERKGFSTSDMRKILDLVDEARDEIIQAWEHHFNDD